MYLKYNLLQVIRIKVLIKINKRICGEIYANFDVIQEFVQGKKTSELEEVTGKTAEEVVDAVTGCTLVDTTGYVTAVIEAAKAAK